MDGHGIAFVLAVSILCLFEGRILVRADDSETTVRQLFLARIDRSKHNGFSPDADLERLAGAIVPSEQAALYRRLLAYEKSHGAAAELRQLGDGYLALGHPFDAARVAAELQRLSPSRPGGYVLASVALHRLGRLDEARIEAKRALELEPTDLAAQAAYRLSNPRGDSQPASAPSFVARQAAAADPARPQAAIRSKLGLPAVPLPGATEYLAPGAKKPPWWKAWWNDKRNAWSMRSHRSTMEETRKLKEVMDLLSSTPTGGALVAELGGWNSILDETRLIFARTGSARAHAYTRPLSWAERGESGKAYALVLNEMFLNHPKEALAPILAHELTHLRDFKAGSLLDRGMFIPSEYAAHRMQIYVYEEVLSKLSEERLRILDSNSVWQYQRFVASLWEDRISERYPTKVAYVSKFATSEERARAGDAYDDLREQIIEPGSPQLDFHIRDVYTNLTSERDLRDLVLDAVNSGQYTLQQATKDRDRLSIRQVMLQSVRSLDDNYRRQNGFRLKGTNEN